MIKSPIKPDSKWRNSLGKFYTVIVVANAKSTRSDSVIYPPMIVYSGESGEVFAKRLGTFLASMKPVVEEHG